VLLKDQIHMNLKIGSAPDSWGVWFPSNDKQTPWQRYLDELVEAGYEWTELGPVGYLPADPVVLQSELSARGVKATGTFVMQHWEDSDHWPDVQAVIRSTCSLITAVGGQYMVVIDDTYSDLFTGKQYRPNNLDDESFKRLTENVQRGAELAKREFGVTAVFHPHAETHVEYEAQIEKLIEQTDPALVQVCLDVGHHAYRKGEPVNFMRKHAKRVTYLHLKSVDPVLRQRVADENMPFALAVAQDMFVEPARGAVDFLALRDLLKELNFDGFGIVEQDMYPAPFDKPLPIAKRTRAYFKEIGLG
jgi:inosose dehydratase